GGRGGGDRDPRPGQGDRPDDGRLRDRRRPDRPDPRRRRGRAGVPGPVRARPGTPGGHAPARPPPRGARPLPAAPGHRGPRGCRGPAGAAAVPPVLGGVRAELRPRLRLLAVLAFSIAFVPGPMNTFLFVYAENALGMSRSATAAL